MGEPTTGDHVSVSGYYSSASVSDSAGLGLYRHHMLVTSQATVVYDEYGVRCFKVNIIHLNKNGIVVGQEELKPGKFRIHTYPSIYSGEEAVRRAWLIKRLRPGCGKKVYNLFSYNCESFVREVKTGEPSSRQVDRTIKAGLGTTSGALFVPSGVIFGSIIGSVVPIPGVGTVVGGIAGGVAAGLFGAALGNINTAVDYVCERMLEN